nr:PTS sugar transporter subunit IIC [Maliibacterium massiliense]
MAANKEKGGGAVSRFAKRYIIDPLSSMALGLFCTLIIGLILGQFAKIPGLGFLEQLTKMVDASSPVVGAAIGVAIAYGMKVRPLVIFSAAVTGAIGYASGGGPVGALVAAIVGAVLGDLVCGRTGGFDIVAVPFVSIISGGLIGVYVGPPIGSFMTALGQAINYATTLQPIPMGILVAVIMGMALTAPISSAAIAISIGLDGLAAGAAVAGCCAQMVGFAAASRRDNSWGGVLAQGLGTSMLQVGNIIRRPQIWIAPTLAAAVVGPISTAVFRMSCNALGAGMGTSGLVGQFATWATMSPTTNTWLLLGEIALVHFVLPIALTLLFDAGLRKLGWVRSGDMKLADAA